MELNEAAALWARLQAHFPSLGGTSDDGMAQMRAQDWLDAIAGQTTEDAQAGISALIGSSRYPRIGDFHEAIERQASRPKPIDARALAQGEMPIEERNRVGMAGLELVRAALNKTTGPKARTVLTKAVEKMEQA